MPKRPKVGTEFDFDTHVIDLARHPDGARRLEALNKVLLERYRYRLLRWVLAGGVGLLAAVAGWAAATGDASALVIVWAVVAPVLTGTIGYYFGVGAGRTQVSDQREQRDDGGNSDDDIGSSG